VKKEFMDRTRLHIYYKYKTYTKYSNEIKTTAYLHNEVFGIVTTCVGGLRFCDLWEVFCIVTTYGRSLVS